MKIVKPDLSSLWTKICTEDDISSFEALYHLLGSRLLRFSIYYVSSKEVAEEIVSEVFVKCWENRKASMHVLNPETYLFAAIRNQSLKYLRKHQQIHLVEIDDQHEQLFVAESNPQKELERKELQRKLDEAIDTLPPQARLVFKLIKENGMKYKEVAEILEISPRTVQTQLFRAIAKLRVVLSAYREIDQKSNLPDHAIGLILILALMNYIFIFCRQF
ncbi:RNA polymerase sigma-70 factor [Pedobacter gandavensis]|uniref:RNA polymerase sigma-70 factor n=1 Tax=Pedobacter gandavensis TaxID=2679963 RepID=UPI0016017B41|nr:RNA polymerase sigma-70 factor [Pedobacter gandavensis]